MPDHPLFLGELMSLGAALAWAIAVFQFRRAKEVDPLALNLFKNTIALGLFAATMLAFGQRPDSARSSADWLRLGASGLLGLTLGDTLFFAGLRRIGPSVAAVTDCTYSPVVVLLSVLLLGEPLRWSLVAAIPLVVSGLLLVSWPRPAGSAHLRVDRVGVALAMGGVAATALGVVIAKPVLARCDIVEATTVRMAVGVVSLLLVQAVRRQLGASAQLFRSTATVRLLFLPTVFGTYISMGLWLGGMKYAAASRAALLNQMATVFLIVITRVFGQEPVSGRKWVGASLALAGAVTVLVG